MKSIGIDQSINSTGVCIVEEGKDPIYYIITNKLTKKQKAINSNRFHYMVYNKTDELNNNIREISNIIKDIIIQHKPDYVVMEAPAFQANGRVIDLSILNGYIRCILDICNIEYITAPPTTIKKFFTANGQADKELMVFNWSKVDPSMYKELETVKVDDIADAYSMAVYGLSAKSEKLKLI